MVTNKLIFNLLTTCVLLSVSMSAKAQNVSVFASDLKAPTRLLVTEGGNLLVAEAGAGINDGRVSIIDRTGQRRTLIDGLPAAPRCGGLFEKNSGPAGIALRGTTLFISIGAGDNCGELVFGEDKGTLTFRGKASLNLSGDRFIENPDPASPLFRSVLVVSFAQPVDSLAGGFSLPTVLHKAVADGAEVTLTSTDGAQARLRQLVQFPFQPAECLYPGLFGDCPNYASDPSALALFGQSLFVVDGRLRVVYQTSLETGAFVTHPLCLNDSECESFGFRSNAPFPANTGLSVAGDKLLVTLDSGDIRSLDPATSQVMIFKPALSTDDGIFGEAVDAITVNSRCSGEQLYLLQPAPVFCPPVPDPPCPDCPIELPPCTPLSERLLRFDSQTGKFVLVAEFSPPGSVPQATQPVSLAHAARTGQLFVALFGTNQIVRVTDPDVDLMTQPVYDVSIQDEQSGHLLRFNSRTGEYVFTRCGADGLTFSGKGSVRGQGCRIELRDARVTAEIDRCPIAPRNTGRAIISVTPVGPFFALFDRDITSHACGCPG
jgi:hypothetical protein